jgi:hypothetical protein
MPPVFENVRIMEREPMPQAPDGLDPAVKMYLDQVLKKFQEQQFKIAKDFGDIKIDLDSLIP